MESFVVNPVHSQRAASDLDLVYVGTEDQVIMIEGEAKEIPEADFVAALAFAHEEVRHLIVAQKELMVAAGKPKRQAALFVVPDELLEIAYRVAGDRIEAALYTPSKSPGKKRSRRSETKSTPPSWRPIPKRPSSRSARL